MKAVVKHDRYAICDCTFFNTILLILNLSYENIVGSQREALYIITGNF